MRLTSSGDTVVTLARRWRTDERRADADLKRLLGINQGHVRLIAMDSHANGFLPRVVQVIAEKHPRISLEIQIANTDEAQAALLGGEADLVTAFNLTPHRDLHVICRLAAWWRRGTY
jgi:DNA-binding transcriptional LysR family regulator